jgi:hypothetical protein
MDRGIALIGVSNLCGSIGGERGLCDERLVGCEQNVSPLNRSNKNHCVHSVCGKAEAGYKVLAAFLRHRTHLSPSVNNLYL